MWEPLDCIIVLVEVEMSITISPFMYTLYPETEIKIGAHAVIIVCAREKVLEAIHYYLRPCLTPRLLGDQALYYTFSH